MKVSHLRISNILGIDELEFSPAGFNEISGQNGTGKTSVLEAIKAATGTGHDATLLRKGADKGEVVLVLEDGTEIQRRVTASSSKTDVLRDGKKVQKPGEAIKALVDTLSVNPVEFLTARKQDRVKVLLEAMPIRVDAERLGSIAGFPVTVGEDEHGLGVIDAVRKQVFDDRTGTNRAVKEKDATINQLKLAMPDAPGGVEGSEDELRAQVTAATDAKDAELERVRAKLDGLEKEKNAKLDVLRAETQAKIDAIKAEAAAQAEELNAAFTDIERKAGIQRERTIQKHTDTVTPINQAIASIVANRGAHAKREQALATIEKMEEELEELTADAAAQTKALESIDAYKIELLASLPIPGVEVRDGEIFRDGVPFDRLNTAQQVTIAVEIAKLRAGDLQVCCVDRIECLDPAAFEAFREQILASDLQLFVTKVTGEEFSVNTSAAAE